MKQVTPGVSHDDAWCWLVSSTPEGLTSIAVAGAYAANVADAWEKVGLTATVCGQ